MTATFGVFDKNTADVSADSATMMKYIEEYTFDHKAIWSDGPIAIAQATVFNTPESFFENLPFNNPDCNLTIAGDIRLDNRLELFAKLGIALKNQITFSDAQLIIAAYLKWGEYCPEQLIGDFAFALWDSNKKKLYCCTDHFNKKGLYYFYKDGKFIFSSIPHSIPLVKGVDSLVNQNKLTTFLYPMSKHFFWEESWIENIFSIPAATIFTVDREGIKKRKYYTPQLQKTLSFKNEAEFSEAFQDVFYRAVNDRLRSNYPITATLSGGLDSSSVVAVAAKILEKKNKQLDVFSSVLPDNHEPDLTDERYYIDLFKSFKNVNINYITVQDKGFISDLNGPLLKNLAGPTASSRHYLGSAFFEKAADLGSRVTLTGDGGEMGVSNYASGIYAEFFTQLRWAKLWREIRSRKKLTGESILGNVKHKIIAPLVTNKLMHLLKKQYSGLTADETHFLQPDFAAILKERLNTKGFDKTKLPLGITANHRENQLQGLIRVQNKSHSNWMPFITENRHPLMDLRLLEFCQAVPDEFKLRNGYQRYVLRAGLDKILPTEIQWRNTKTPFSPDYHYRYNQQLPLLRDYMFAIKQNDPIRSIIDVEKIKGWINIRVANNEKGSLAEIISRDTIPQAIYLIEFLRRFKEFKN